MSDMRLLVCGGRRFANVPQLWSILDRINRKRIAEHGDGIRCLIDGGQQHQMPDGSIVGADYWAHQWARATGTATERYFADWKQFGRSAGPLRNKRMRDEGMPTHGLAMPGGDGTAGMVALLKEKSIPVWEVEA